MKVAPFAVFAAMASSIAVEGLGILIVFGTLHRRLLSGAGGAVDRAARRRRGRSSASPQRPPADPEIREPFLITFATASSEASYPKLLEALERFGVPNRIASFVLPLGLFSFNLDGSMMYCAFASIFIAQAYGIDLTLGQEIAMLVLLMITSKGIAGVPRACAGRHRGDAALFQHSRGRAAADPRGRSLPRHGPQRDQRHRQCRGDRASWQNGMRTTRKRCHPRPSTSVSPSSTRQRGCSPPALLPR